MRGDSILQKMPESNNFKINSDKSINISKHPEDALKYGAIDGFPKLVDKLSLKPFWGAIPKYRKHW